MRIAWNKGLTKADPRVKSYCNSEGCKNSQFTSGPRLHTRGENHYNWKGGRIIYKGYVYIRQPTHIHAKNGYVLEHRLLIEKEINRLLTSTELIHHINKIGTDNRLENLKLVTAREHILEHRPQLQRKWRPIKTKELKE